MNKRIVKFIFPWAALAAGIAGFFLSRSLYTGAVLLKSNHPAGIALLLLSAATLLLLAYGAQQLPRKAAYPLVYPKNIFGGIGSCIGAVGIAYTCILRFSQRDVLSVLVLIFGILAAFCLLLSGTQRFFDMRPHWLLHVSVTVYFMALGLSQCRDWGVQTQVLRYLFSLLGSMFLLLTAYHRTVNAYNGKNLRSLFFYQNAALLFCLAAYPAQYNFFYLTSALWMLLDAPSAESFVKE